MHLTTGAVDIILETFGAHLKLNACACGQHVT